jgi:hypothetical protein
LNSHSVSLIFTLSHSFPTPKGIAPLTISGSYRTTELPTSDQILPHFPFACIYAHLECQEYNDVLDNVILPSLATTSSTSNDSASSSLSSSSSSTVIFSRPVQPSIDNYDQDDEDDEDEFDYDGEDIYEGYPMENEEEPQSEPHRIIGYGDSIIESLDLSSLCDFVLQIRFVPSSFDDRKLSILLLSPN